MQTGVIIRRNPDSFIPNEYLEKAIEANSKGWGAAIVKEGKILTAYGKEAITLEDFQTTMKTFPNCPIVFYLYNSDAATSQEDVSPIVVLSKTEGKKEIPLIVGFAEGNYPGYAKKESAHSPEFFLMNTHIIPNIGNVAELADNDLAKIDKFIEKPQFRNQVAAQAIERGYVMLLSASGLIHTMARGDTHSEYTWGYVTQNYGYALAPVEEPKPEKKEKKSIFDDEEEEVVGDKKIDTKSVSTTREKYVPPAVADAVKPPKTDTSVIKDYTVVEWSPTAGMSRTERQNEYKRMLGYLPEGHEKSVKVRVWKSAKTSKLLPMSEIKKLGLDALGLPKLNNPKGVGASGPNGADDHKAVSSEILPILAPKSKEYLKEFICREDIKKIIAENGDVLTDPAKVKGLEAKIVGLDKQLGLKDLNDFMSLKFETMCELEEKAPPRTMANIMFNFRNIIVSLLHKSRSHVEAEESIEAEIVPAKKSIFG